MKSTIINTAKSYIGVIEGSSEHKSIIDLYNEINPLPVGYKVKYTDSWCMAFVSAIFEKCDLLDLIYGGECGCQRMITLLTSKGVYKTSGTIKAGDILFYDWNNDDYSDHVGIVTAVSGSTLTVIEGNYSDSVKYRTLSTSSANIQGYARPEYIETSETVETTTTGEIDTDGIFGPATTKKAQAVFGTVVDGIVSNQLISCKEYLENASTTSWNFESTRKGGSLLIKAMQKEFGLTGASIDGYAGIDTVKAMQKALGFTGKDIDGYMGVKTVKALQNYLNKK